VRHGLRLSVTLPSRQREQAVVPVHSPAPFAGSFTVNVLRQRTVDMAVEVHGALPAPPSEKQVCRREFAAHGFRVRDAIVPLSSWSACAISS